jgi:hypothetical protein
MEVRGAVAVASQAVTYERTDVATRLALVDGVIGVVSTTLDGESFSVGAFTVREGRIVEMDFVADPDRLRHLDLTILDDCGFPGPQESG